MTEDTSIEDALRLAREGDQVSFARLTAPYRRELHVHCYRILGSAQDAEDTLQETLLAAWKGLEAFEGRASVRLWLYRIATNRCFNALRDKGRRPLELSMSSLARPPRSDPSWLEPYPDALLDKISDGSVGPEARYEQKESISLAFIVALQHLTANQRAALILHDVLGFPSSEAAEVLQSSEASINSSLQRARARLSQRITSNSNDDIYITGSRNELSTMTQFADAFERGDVTGVVNLLRDDAWLTMPPQPGELCGHSDIAAYLSRLFSTRGHVRLMPTRANGQPAFGCYVKNALSIQFQAEGVIVLEVEDGRISYLARFALIDVVPFGLPPLLSLKP